MLATLVAYAGATLLHHVHNAQFLAAYPNMPAWLSPGRIYLAWLGATGAGVLGYLLLRSGRSALGPVLLVAYALYGFDALAHYALAPVSAHSATMHATIGLELFTAALLLGQLARWRLRPRS